MTRGPVPPHERAWRHPSELAAPPHEPTSRVGRMLIATTATVGLLLVGVLALSMTPDRLGSPDEPAAATSDVVVTPGANPVGAGPGGAPQSAADSILRVVSSFLTSTSAPSATPPEPLALPVDATTIAAPVVSEEPTSPSSTTTPPPIASEPPPPTTQDIDPSSSSSAAAATSLVAFTTHVDDPVELDAGSFDDSEFALSGGDELLPPLSLGTTTSSSTVVGQSTTSTSSTSSTTSTSSSSSSTVPESSTSLQIPPKQLNNG